MTPPQPERRETVSDKRARLLALAERCERGPISHQLAEAVLVACGWQADAVMLTTPEGRSITRMEMPHPLHSVDAALALVPKDREWLVRAPVKSGDRDQMAALFLASVPDAEHNEMIYGRGHTPAAALTAAALRAIAAALKSEG